MPFFIATGVVFYGVVKMQEMGVNSECRVGDGDGRDWEEEAAMISMSETSLAGASFDQAKAAPCTDE